MRSPYSTAARPAVGRDVVHDEKKTCSSAARRISRRAQDGPVARSKRALTPSHQDRGARPPAPARPARPLRSTSSSYDRPGGATICIGCAVDDARTSCAGSRGAATRPSSACCSAPASIGPREAERRRRVVRDAVARAGSGATAAPASRRAARARVSRRAAVSARHAAAAIRRSSSRCSSSARCAGDRASRAARPRSPWSRRSWPALRARRISCELVFARLLEQRPVTECCELDGPWAARRRREEHVDSEQSSWTRASIAPRAASGRRGRRSRRRCRPGRRRAPPPDRREQLLDRRRAAPRRAARARAASRPGAGSAGRSSLPFAVTGSASSSTNADGTMYAGSDAAR